MRTATLLSKQSYFILFYSDGTFAFRADIVLAVLLHLSSLSHCYANTHPMKPLFTAITTNHEPKKLQTIDMMTLKYYKHMY